MIIGQIIQAGQLGHGPSNFLLQNTYNFLFNINFEIIINLELRMYLHTYFQTWYFTFNDISAKLYHFTE